MGKDVLRVILFRGVEGGGVLVGSECMFLPTGLTFLM